MDGAIRDLISNVIGIKIAFTTTSASLCLYGMVVGRDHDCDRGSLGVRKYDERSQSCVAIVGCLL